MKDPVKRSLQALAWPVLSGLALTIILSWFAVNQYMTAVPLAEDNLRGLALSLAAAVEAISGREPHSFQPLEAFQTPDIAYLEILDSKGHILYHSNRALIGGRVTDQRSSGVFARGEFTAGRILLGTGEEIYESNSPIHVRGETLALRLALHTYMADSVIRRARAGMAVSFTLIAATWILGILLYRALRRAETHKLEMARREQLAKMGEMGAVLAHEIRNPLAGIKGYAQLLQERLAPGDDGASAELIVGEAVRLEEMVNELLDYSRSDTPPAKTVDLVEAIARAIEIVTPEAEAAGVVIETAMDGPLFVAGNRDRLEQLFLNLFRNALQAMAGGGKLRIKARLGKTGIEAAVADTGPGIGEEHLGRVFEPFYTTKARGTGLGLAICRKIAEDHDGVIDVESRPGEGAAFRLEFPPAKGKKRGSKPLRSR